MSEDQREQQDKHYSEDLPDRTPDTWALTRRDFVKTAAALTGGVALGVPAIAQAQRKQDASAITTHTMPAKFMVNGKEHAVDIDPRTSLLDLLREEISLTGTKKGCDHGQCGACTVLVNGRRVNSCLTLAITTQGDQITTVEGLANGDELHPVQQAFLDHDGFQCGYCTPGQICSAVALGDEMKRGEPSIVTWETNHAVASGSTLVFFGSAASVSLSANEIRERMSGNICRCGAYPGIVAAIEQVYPRPSASVGPNPSRYELTKEG